MFCLGKPLLTRESVTHIRCNTEQTHALSRIAVCAILWYLDSSFHTFSTVFWLFWDTALNVPHCTQTSAWIESLAHDFTWNWVICYFLILWNQENFKYANESSKGFSLATKHMRRASKVQKHGLEMKGVVPKWRIGLSHDVEHAKIAQSFRVLILGANSRFHNQPDVLTRK